MIIRKAAPEDIPDLARIHLESLNKSYEGLVDPGYLASQTIEQRIEDWHKWFEEPQSASMIAFNKEGRPIGFVSYGKLQTPPPGTSHIRPLYSAEIYAICVMPDAWSQGIGRQLMEETAKALKEWKHHSLCLWVLDGNTRAKSFYEKMGGQRIGKKMTEIGPSMLKEVCYGWRDVGMLITS